VTHDPDDDLFRAHGASALRPGSQKNYLIGCPEWWWEETFAVTRGKEEFACAIVLWKLRVMKGNGVPARIIKITNEDLAKFGINRFVKYRTLKRLGAAELIRAKHQGKASTEVTFLRRKRVRGGLCK